MHHNSHRHWWKPHNGPYPPVTIPKSCNICQNAEFLRGISCFWFFDAQNEGQDDLMTATHVTHVLSYTYVKCTFYTYVKYFLCKSVLLNWRCLLYFRELLSIFFTLRCNSNFDRECHFQYPSALFEMLWWNNRNHWRIQGGAPGTPPRGSKFFHFHAVFGKKLKNNSTFGSWRPPGKILDPPLVTTWYFKRFAA